MVWSMLLFGGASMAVVERGSVEEDEDGCITCERK
jgi:hypothetical protein